MKLRGKIFLGLLATAIILVIWWLAVPNRALHQLEATRRSLRQQGFKIDLAEFNLSIPPDVRQRAAVLGTITRADLTNRARMNPVRLNIPQLPALMTPVGDDAALVVWTSERPDSRAGRGLWAQVRTLPFPSAEFPSGEPDFWAALRESLKTNRARLDAVRQAALSGPIRFEPIGPGPNALLPYLADLKGDETALSAQALVALHDGEKDFAWTNLLACTCIATEYTPEPIEISHLVRFACAGIAFQTTWNALQLHNWTDVQLTELQKRWIAADFWTHLPETAAYSRADSAALCQFERKQTIGSEIPFRELLRSPRQGWYALQSYWRGAGYRHKGSYEDETALLLHYRDRELELRRAVQCSNWSDMRQVPGATNFIPFTAKNHSRVTVMLNMRQMNLSFQGEGRRLLGRAAEAESCRRLAIVAIALERYRLKQGTYPDALPKLAPEFVSSLQVDFIDGKPLRYRRSDDGHFVLYSIGLDCVDDGGQLRRQRKSNVSRGGSVEIAPPFLESVQADIVWPRPASEPEIARLQEEQRLAAKKQWDKGEEQGADFQWAHTARRQAKVEQILKSQAVAIKEPVRRGRSLSNLLRNEQASGTNKLSISDMLVLKPVPTPLEPETITFEFPIRYDALTNIGELQLYIDPCEDDDSDEGCVAGQFECSRATNGNCLLAWSTIYETPGKHALQAGLMLHDPGNRLHDISGPLFPITLTNLCQFSLSSAHYQPEFGATLRVKFPESNATCRLEIKSPAGALLKTIKAETSNGVMNIFWDLTADNGKRCTNDAFDTVFHIALPDSGKIQTLKGP